MSNHTITYLVGACLTVLGLIAFAMLVLIPAVSSYRRLVERAAAAVPTIELKVADAPVGRLRMRTREAAPDSALLRLVTTLIASEVERVRAPERASEAAAEAFLHAVLAGQIEDREDIVARGKEL